MTFESLKQNLIRIKETVREMYIFTNQLEIIRNLEKNSSVVINTREKKLILDAIDALEVQLRVLNNSIPELIKNLGFYKKLNEDSRKEKEDKLVRVNYFPGQQMEKVSVTINNEDKKEFVENLGKSNSLIGQLKQQFSAEKAPATFGKPNEYAKISNRFFRDYSSRLVAEGKFKDLNEELRRMNSPFVLSTYLSMIFFTVSWTFILGILVVLFMLFFDVGLLFPFISIAQDGIASRFLRFFWIIFLLPLLAGFLMYYYPSSEKKSIGQRIDQELPFVTIHMSAIATAGVEPMSIFKILLKNDEYKYTSTELRKLMNLINVQGYDLITALKKTAKASPSNKLRELLDGMATAITSGGSLHDFLTKHAEGLLFDYKLERERYTKTSETFMDIYISIVIAAPMILLTLFVIIGTTCMSLAGLTTETMNLLIMVITIVLNIGFLVFLHMKQPAF